MNSLPPNTAPRPVSLRASALARLIDNVVTALNTLGEEGPEPLGSGWRGTFREAELWQALRRKCGELSDLVCRADRPGAAAAYVLGYLPKHFEDILDLLFGRKRLRAPGGLEAARPVASADGSRGADPRVALPGP
jgi:hypothetical protein